MNATNRISSSTISTTTTTTSSTTTSSPNIVTSTNYRYKSPTTDRPTLQHNVTANTHIEHHSSNIYDSDKDIRKIPTNKTASSGISHLVPCE